MGRLRLFDVASSKTGSEKKKGLFITFEGIDGCGKTTLTRSVCQALEKEKISFIHTREPGGTPVGENIRSILLHNQEALSGEAQTLLHFAIRQEHLEKVIRPSLGKGKYVLCERYVDSTWAYQHIGLGVPGAFITSLEKFIVQETWPDFTFIIDITVEESLKRTQRRLSHAHDRYEQFDRELKEKMRSYFLKLGEKDTKRYHILNGTEHITSLTKKILTHITFSPLPNNVFE